MKKILSIFTIAVIFTACKSKTDLNANKNMVLVDTTGLSKSNVLTDVGNNKYVINSKAIAEPVENKAPVKQRPVTNNSGAGNSGGSNNTSTAQAPVKQDKGWSHAAKGTAVGAGTGAIFGAVVNKEHRAKGALIGTVIGAGAGYLIGRKTDQNTGRVERAKARKATNQ